MPVTPLGDIPDECVVFDRHETARYLRLGLSTVAELTARRELRSLKVGRRRLYRRADLDDWLSSKVEGGAA
ncbi:MAG: helix-turn-helix domain-containing protein [Actinomycetota bacterium]|nr:helix-turn-helix domain-containing protein [Actinomycetota bacterium]